MALRFSPRPKIDTSALPSLKQMKAVIPIQLLPVRLQVKYVQNTAEELAWYSKQHPSVKRYPLELLVRIYPDQLSIHRHEEQLTASEIVAGQEYWRQALTAPDREAGTPHSLQAWRSLLGRYGAHRARWVLQETQPSQLAQLIELADAVAQQPVVRNDEESGTDKRWNEVFEKLNDFFPTTKPAPSAWQQAAKALCLPDRFVVALYRKKTSPADVEDVYIKDLLIDNTAVGYDPTNTTSNPKLPLVNTEIFDSITDLTAEFLDLVRLEMGAEIKDNEITVGLNGAGSGPADEAKVPGEPAPGEVTNNDLGKGGLSGPLAWMADFGAAVEVGMGVVVALNPEDLEIGFDRLIVVGTRPEYAPDDEAKRLTQLLESHAFTDGMELIPQGMPTNNTGESSGYGSDEQYDAVATFEKYLQSPLYQVQPPDMPQERHSDGQRLATTLGLEASSFVHTGYAGGHDATHATLMNRTLWPATFGYFLREMLEPVVGSKQLTQDTRRFFEEYVTGRGPAPAFRVGNVPYGVLPTTWYSQLYPVEVLGSFGKVSWDIIRSLDATWTERLNAFVDYPPIFKTETPFASMPPSRQDILTVLGQEAASVEFYQRYFVGPNLMDTLAHRANASGDKLWPPVPSFDLGGIRDVKSYSVNGRPNVPGRYEPGNEENPIYSNFRNYFDPKDSFRTSPKQWSHVFDVNYQVGYRKVVHTYADEPRPANETIGSMVDDAQLSELYRIRPLLATDASVVATITSDPKDKKLHNYIHWLSQSTFDAIRLQDFTVNGSLPADFNPPNSLLYFMLRQAVMWRFWEAAEDYLNTQGTSIDRQETELFNILQSPQDARWQCLYHRINGGPVAHEWLIDPDNTHPIAVALRTYRKDLLQLAVLSTAQLERLLAEHLDLGNHRLDAWKTGQVMARMLELRRKNPVGTYLGAFGWLENIRHQDKAKPNKSGIYEDPDNLGYVHAPSINHGVTAAVLRQGYKSRQFETGADNPAANRMAINLSSARVRRALALLEGIRTGNSLAALLGRDFEAGLFRAKSNTGQSFAVYIPRFRELFPYADEKATPPGTPARTPSPEQDAKQLVDGLALLKRYPFNRGQFTIPAADAADFWRAVKHEIDQLQNTLDALGDLTVGESIHQAVMGNVDQAAAVLENVAKGKFPTAPDVVHPSRGGVALTHRVLLHLPQAAPASLSAQWGPPTALALAEPALNNWLAGFFGDVAGLRFAYTYQVGNALPVSAPPLSLSQLNVHPLDLLLRLDANALQSGSALDAHMTHSIRMDTSWASKPSDPNLNGLVVIDYAAAGPMSLRRLLPLLWRIRQLLASSRPALAPDLSGPSRLAPGQAASNMSGINQADVSGRLAAVEAILQNAVGTNGLPARLVALQQAATSPASAAYTSSLLALRTTLYELGAYNLPEATLAASPAVTAPLEAATAVQQIIVRRLAAARQSLAEPDLGIRYAEQAKALLGNEFRLSIPVQLDNQPLTDPNNPEAVYAAAYRNGPALLGHHPDPVLVMEEWLQGLAPVRDTLNHLEKIYMLSELLVGGAASGSLPALTPAQITARATTREYWLGAAYPSKGYTPPNDAVSLVQIVPELTPSAYQPTGWQQALWLDEWVEVIPHKLEDTALVFHYDQPNMEAPQTLLTAVAHNPLGEAQWHWDGLLGTVSETLDFAKKRAVEPANLSYTHLGALLPLLVAPVAKEGVTMTLDWQQLVFKNNQESPPFLTKEFEAN